MSKQKKRPQPVGDAIASFFKSSGLSDRIDQAQIIPEWASLVGAQIASVTHPISITPDGVLFVAVKTHGWMTELSMMEPDLLRALNQRTGNSKVVRIHWRLMRA